MLKNKFRYLISIIFIAIILNSTPSIAADDLNIDRWIIDANLLENGDLKISEDITFSFNASFNGVYRNINLEDIDSIDDLSIYEMVSGKEIPYEEVGSATKGDNHKFTSKKDEKKLEIQLFAPSADETKTFRLKYRLENIAIKHSDTAELYYKFLGKENKTYIDYLSINLSLPRFEKDHINIFAHGPKQGKIYFSDGRIKSEIDNINPQEFIENRILFPNEYIPTSEKMGNKDFNSIIEEEQVFSEKIEKDRIRKVKNKNLLGKASIYFSSFLSLLVIFVLYKSRRSKDVFETMTSQYPDDITPAELSLFMNKTISLRSFLSSLFYLDFKEYLEIGEIKTEKRNSTNEYIFKRTAENEEDLTSAEDFLINWIFNDIGDGKILTTLDLEEYRKKNSKAFYTSQNKWNKLVKKDLKDRNYYDNNSKIFGIIITIASILSFIIGIISLAFESLYGLIPLILGIFILIYGISLLYRTNDRGYIQYTLWKDFKDRFKKEATKSVDIADDKAIIYAIALDLPMKDLNLFRDSIAHSYYPIGWGYLYFLTNKSGGSQFEDTFNNRFYGYNQSSTSTSSSTFGGGGGFTGGGGGGVGGGGAGGF